MFFLHDFSLNPPAMPGIEKEDDAEVLALMKVDMKKKKPQPLVFSDTLTWESVDYPLGAMPEWSRVEDAFSKRPLQLMRFWSFPSIQVSVVYERRKLALPESYYAF